MQNDETNLTIDRLKEKISRLHPGDTVEIWDEDLCTSYLAKVEKIYPNIVLFRKNNGIAVSFDYFTAAQVNVVKPAGYEARSDEMEIDDMSKALQDAGR